jgi:uncharacterized protein YunC (DUF1805 family)
MKIELWDIAALVPYENNVKKHELAQVSKIAASIQRHGWTQPIVVDKNGVIIAGHGRRLAALELGLKRVPVLVRSDLTEDEVKALRLADNRVAMSDYDPEMLKVELASLEADMSGIFDDKELEFLDADLGEMNAGAFVSDMDVVVAEQKADLSARAESAAAAQIAIAKAFGVKTIPAASQMLVNKVMALAEAQGAEKGLKGADALVAWLAKQAGEPA